MLVMGVVGAPNKGKSTFFSAATLVDVAIADYPFTTIEPNKGVTYVRAPCPHLELGVSCNPKNSKCEAGVRLIPTTLIDVAGLVPDAHAGRGLGNKFLDDLRAADALIQVIDASGRTDVEGKACEACDPAEEIRFLEEEISQWVFGILHKAWPKLKGKGIAEVAGMLSGLKITLRDAEEAARKNALSEEAINWSEADLLSFARSIREVSKPIVIAANKIDLPEARENFKRLKQEFPEKIILPCYAEGELALRRAARGGVVRYVPGDAGFEIVKASPAQEQALESIRAVMEKNGGTGVQAIINEVAFNQLKLIPVYPVEDEAKYANHFGEVLPDAFLLPKGSTALDLAAKIHSDLAKNFVCAVNARTRMRVGRDYVLQGNDVVKIVAGR